MGRCLRDFLSTLFRVRWAWSHQQQLLANSFDIVFMAQNVAERSGAAVKFWLKLNKFYYGKKKRWRSLEKVSYFYCFTWETSTIFFEWALEAMKVSPIREFHREKFKFFHFSKVELYSINVIFQFPKSAIFSSSRCCVCHVEEIHVLRVKRWLIALASGGAMPTLPPFILD